jgi:hypothetical protein
MLQFDRTKLSTAALSAAQSFSATPPKTTAIFSGRPSL